MRPEGHDTHHVGDTISDCKLLRLGSIVIEARGPLVALRDVSALRHQFQAQCKDSLCLGPMSTEADVDRPHNASHGIQLNLLELLSPSLNISSFVDESSCERWLPQVPNMVGWTEWLFACVRSWSCDFRQKPAVLVAPPPNFTTTGHSRRC